MRRDPEACQREEASTTPAAGARTNRNARLRQLAEQVLEVPDLSSLTSLLTRDLPESLGLSHTSLLLWDRKLDSFESLTTGETRAQAVRSAPAEEPAGRWLLSDGLLLETPHGETDSILVPLMARAGVVGMLLLGQRLSSRKPREAPLSQTEARLVSELAVRAALALENHLYQREVVASERMAALGTMAGMLAHDFRGPMTIIRGYAETLLEDGVGEQDVKGRALLIVQAVDRLERMTTETLDFARGGGKLARRSLPLRLLLEDLARGLPDEVPGLTVVPDFELGGETASLDVDKLHRVVGNMAANARDAMGGKGRLHLRARCETRDGRPWLVLLVRDEGPGVPPEIQDRVFEPFVTKGKKQGTGLGLAVSKRFVEDHGGRISLLPEGPGAAFRIELPLEPLPEPPKA